MSDFKKTAFGWLNYPYHIRKVQGATGVMYWIYNTRSNTRVLAEAGRYDTALSYTDLEKAKRHVLDLKIRDEIANEILKELK